MRKNVFLKDQETHSAPTIEIFGGLFALLLVLFVIISLLSESSNRERMEAINNKGEFKIGWDGTGSGYVIISYPDSLFIVEENIFVASQAICRQPSKFIDYARKVYSEKSRQLIFAILEGGVGTMAISRNCLMEIMPQEKISIGWIVADNELLKSVSIGDMPAYIDKVFDAGDVQ